MTTLFQIIDAIAAGCATLSPFALGVLVYLWAVSQPPPPEREP